MLFIANCGELDLRGRRIFPNGQGGTVLKSGIIFCGALCSAVLAIAFTPSPAKADDSSVSHVVASGWMATDFHDQSNPGCSIGSDASAPGGRLMMGANRRRPDPINLVIRKTGWLIPAGTQVQVKASFPDGSIIWFNGRGNGQTIEIDIATDQLRGWLHELTSSATMQIVFGGNEPPWTFDLSGTTAVVNAMGDCFRDHRIKGVAPPFDIATVAGGEATQPFSAAQTSQPPESVQSQSPPLATAQTQLPPSKNEPSQSPPPETAQTHAPPATLSSPQNTSPSIPPFNAQTSGLYAPFIGSYGTPTTPDMEKINLSDFGLRVDQGIGQYLNVHFGGNLYNNTEDRLKAYLCTRFYDKNSLEIENQSSEQLNIGPHNSDRVDGKEMIKPALWAQVVKITAYVAKYGCANSSGDAISVIITLSRQ